MTEYKVQSFWCVGCDLQWETDPHWAADYQPLHAHCPHCGGLTEAPDQSDPAYLTELQG